MNQHNESIYERQWLTPNDANEHLPKLRELAKECRVAIEIGCWKGNTATGTLMGLIDSSAPGKLFQIIDINKDYIDGAAIELNRLEFDRNDPRIEFILGSSLEVEFATADMVFIDSWHTYSQLSQELKRFAPNTRKYICCHDSTTFGFVGEDGKAPALVDAIEEFLEASNGEWMLEYQTDMNNGLTVLKRVSGGPTGYTFPISANVYTSSLFGRT